VADIWTNAFFDDERSNAVAIRLEAAQQGRDLTDDDIEAITRISRDRAALMQRLKAALEAGKEAEALKLAREACGLEQQQ
jgi:hypothetical protein